MNIEQRTLVQNRNIMFNIMSCLKFKERYKLCLTTIEFFNNSFKVFKHQKLIEIKFEKHLLSKIWKNIKFKIYIFNCNIIKDVSMLGKIHTLNLYYCKNIVDVSALGNVHTLDLSYCKNIIDVSALGNVHTLIYKDVII